MARQADERAAAPRASAAPLRRPGPALLGGTRILAAAGECSVEALRPGDRVVTRCRGMAVVRAVHRVRLAPGAAVVRIPAGALGRGRPERDVDLLPSQPVVLRDWRARALFGTAEARVAAARLVDGRVIRLAPGDGAAAFAVVLDVGLVLMGEGLELVSAAPDAVSAPGR
ncbi:Hint domain-containing protein [Jannaschia sp. W003]|uniref:Hint domain-containing protein n=1 Tax=Jannaschia sp. W003 TaxID=2867012 RepID=UPI0021A39EBD|nr:Hint domain-containing protein [Jannaschia sp. W003]UWQ20828.1 Hint domain-containing protein [Jannaschia sp. W003]